MGTLPSIITHQETQVHLLWELFETFGNFLFLFLQHLFENRKTGRRIAGDFQLRPRQYVVA